VVVKRRRFEATDVYACRLVVTRNPIVSRNPNSLNEDYASMTQAKTRPGKWKDERLFLSFLRVGRLI